MEDAFQFHFFLLSIAPVGGIKSFGKYEILRILAWASLHRYPEL